MLEKLKSFVERHPYLPIMLVVGLDVAGYVTEGSGETIDVWGRLKAIDTPSGFLAFFPEEIFVAVTAYALSRKMRTLREKEFEVEDVLDKLKRTGRTLEGIWKHDGAASTPRMTMQRREGGRRAARDE